MEVLYRPSRQWVDRRVSVPLSRADNAKLQHIIAERRALDPRINMGTVFQEALREYYQNHHALDLQSAPKEPAKVDRTLERPAQIAVEN